MKSFAIYIVKLISIVYFLFSKKRKTVCDQFLRLQKLIAQNFAFFENKKYTIEISFIMRIVERFTLHLVVYFVLSYESILSDKKIK